MQFTHLTGHPLSVAERTAVSLSLPLLAHHAKLPHHRFWGKISGYRGDFIVVQCYGDDLLAVPRTYFSVDGGVSFTILDTPNYHRNEENAQALKQQLCRLIQGIYMGDPAYEYRVVDPVSGQSVSFKESERLAWFVCETDFHCRAAPRGAVLFSANGQTLHENPMFRGLDTQSSSAAYLNLYIHVRKPIAVAQGFGSTKGQKTLAQEGTFVAADSLDSLLGDVPNGSMWSLKYDTIENVVYGSNKGFPGFVFYHQPQTQVYGSLYVGDGAVNGNVGFMI